VSQRDRQRREGGLLRANVSVAAGTAMSRITGLLSTAALTYAIGATRLSDSYNLANSTPNIVYELILGGVLTATLVPVFTRQFDERDDDATSAVVTIGIIAILLLTAVAFAAAPLVVDLYAGSVHGGNSAQLKEVATHLAYFFMPQIAFYGLMAIGSALLNARRSFFAPAWTPVLNNLIVITALFTLPHVIKGPLSLDAAQHNSTIILVLGLATTAGIAAMAIGLVPALRHANVHLRFNPDWRHPEVARVVRLSGWTVGYVVANQVALLAVYRLALRDSAGLSSYQYAFMFFQLPHGLLAVSIMTTFLPNLATAYTRRDPRAFRHWSSFGLEMTALFVLPASLGYVVLARPIIGLLRHGAFTTAQATMTAEVLAAFAIGLFGFSSYLFILRCFYARNDTRTPFILNVIENSINIAAAYALFGRYGVKGLAWSYAIAYLAAAVISFVVLVLRVGRYPVGRTLAVIARMLVAAVVMAIVVHAVAGRVGSDTGAGAWARTLAGVAAGVVTYAAALALVNLPRHRSRSAPSRPPRPPTSPPPTRPGPRPSGPRPAPARAGAQPAGVGSPGRSLATWPSTSSSGTPRSPSRSPASTGSSRSPRSAPSPSTTSRAPGSPPRPT
jgi:putative peptidoglycan lipid II flippase